MQTILVVDDEQSICQSLEGILQDEGFRTIFASSGEEGLLKAQEEDPDLILLDIWMPGIDGLEVLQQLHKTRPDQLVIMMSGHGTIETAVKATKFGAFDFIEKPLSLEKVLLSIQNALKVHQLVVENRALKAKVGQEHEMIGESAPIRHLKHQIAMVATSSAWVLITGENGTGKELVARAIHSQSPRRGKPFVEVNCAAIPEDLIESELFGHEKGAFTGATQARKGKFDLAHGGTLLLDEIGDMSLKTQAKILRILQERKFERVGGNRTIEVDVRVIAATNKDLEEEIKRGQFREDLYFRLNVVPFHVPTLQDRVEDLPLLSKHFLMLFCHKEGIALRSLTDEALALMARYNWPGNVRELKNLMERLVIMTPEKTIGPQHLPVAIRMAGGAALATSEANTSTLLSFPALGMQDLKEAKEAFEREFILIKLKEHEWNVSRTAEAIGLERSNLHRKIKAYGIEDKSA